jgi:hypothetical protein
MTPAYLPFSTLSEPTAEAVFRFFKTITLYRPRAVPLPEELSPWLTAGRIDERIPADNDPERLVQALAACRQWATERHLGTGAAGAYLKAQPAGTPLYDDDSVTRLRRQIIAGGPTSKLGLADPIFDARLFLAMAEAYDSDNAKAAAELNALQAVEEGVLREMHGGEEPCAKIGPPTAAIAAGEEQGAFMTRQRLSAWAILASQDPDLAPLLVTDSPVVGEELLEYCSGDLLGTPMMELTLPPETDGDHAILQGRLLEWLDQVVVAETPEALFTVEAAAMPNFKVGPPDRELGSPFIRLHLLTGCPCERLLKRLLPQDLEPRWPTGVDAPRHGMIAVIHL